MAPGVLAVSVALHIADGLCQHSPPLFPPQDLAAGRYAAGQAAGAAAASTAQGCVAIQQACDAGPNGWLSVLHDNIADGCCCVAEARCRIRPWRALVRVQIEAAPVPMLPTPRAMISE